MVIVSLEYKIHHSGKFITREALLLHLRNGSTASYRTYIALWTFCDLNYGVRKSPWAGSTALNKNEALFCVHAQCSHYSIQNLFLLTKSSSQYGYKHSNQILSYFLISDASEPISVVEPGVTDWRMKSLVNLTGKSLPTSSSGIPIDWLSFQLDHLLEGDAAGWWQLR